MRRLSCVKTLAFVSILACVLSTAAHAQARRRYGAPPWLSSAMAEPRTAAMEDGSLPPLTESFTAAPFANSIARPLVPTTSLPEDAAWEGWLAPGVGGRQLHFVEYHGKLYMSGVVAAGHVAAVNLMTWDGSRFEAGPPLPGTPSTTAMTVWNDHLIVATSYGNRILMLDGAAWDTLATLDRTARAMTVYAGDLVIGGGFTQVNGQPANRVARWNGTAWSAFGSGFPGPNAQVYALTVHAGQLVAGGSLTPNNVSGWNASAGAWQPFGGTFDGTVQSLASDGITLYAAGTFTQSGAAAVVRNARWDGSQWLAVGPAFTPPGGTSWPSSVTTWNGGAVFDRPINIDHLAFWDGSGLSAMGDSLGVTIFNFYMTQLGTWGNKLVASGPFQLQGTTPVNGILIYDGHSWSTPLEPWDDQMLGPEGGSIGDLVTWNGKLLFGGEPQMAADHDHFVSCRGFCVWDGTHWSGMGSKFYTTNPKYFGTYHGDLVAVGASVNLGYAGRWNGSEWIPIGAIPSKYGNAVQEYHNDLYVTYWTDDLNPRGIARWDGITWQSVGTGLSYEGSPYLASGVSMCLLGDSLVVGGQFDHAGPVPANNIALWDGAAWHAIGDGLAGDPYVVGNEIDAVAIWNGQLVAGGFFSNSGTQPLQGAAIWNGATWQQLGSNIVEAVSFRVADGVLFASGRFRLPDDTEVYSVARWTGTDWHILGSGSSYFSSIGVYDGYLYASGSGLVNGHVSHGLSRIPLYATLDAPPPQAHESRLVLTVSPNPTRGLIALSFSLPTAGHVRLTLHDVSGREVSHPMDRELAAGPHQVAWPTAAAPGIYFARLSSPAGIRTARFVVLGR